MSEIGPQERPVDLEQGGTPARPHAAPPPPPSPEPSDAGFDLNQPTIISLLYLSAFVLGITAIVGVVLAYVWKQQPHAEWEVSHYRYHIRTFWLGLIGSIVSILLLVVLIGILLGVAVAVLVIVRSVLALLAAQKREPMPNPDSWLV